MHSLISLWCISEDGLAVNVGKYRRAKVTVSFVVSAADTLLCDSLRDRIQCIWSPLTLEPLFIMPASNAELLLPV